jgi:hypothetical protein
MLVLALATGGWFLSQANQKSTPAPIKEEVENDTQAGERTILYAPLTAGRQETAKHQVGHAYVYPGNPSWIYLSLESLETDTPASSETIHCEVVRRDGSTVPVGTFPLTHGHGAWGGPAPVDRNTLKTAKLISGRGHTLATAHFTAPSKKSSQPPPQSHVEHRRHGH